MTIEPNAFYPSTVELAQAAIEQKKLAHRNHRGRNISTVMGLIAGAIVFAVLALAFDSVKLNTQLWLMICLPVGTTVGAWRGQKLKQQLAACPVCQYKWEIKRGRTVPLSEYMEGWDKCPGCGLLMADWALEHIAAGKQPIK